MLFYIDLLKCLIVSFTNLDCSADSHIESMLLSNLGTAGLGHAAEVSIEPDISALDRET